MELAVADVLQALYASPVATFGENLKRLRLERGITQEALAERLKLKRQTTVSAWEKGRRTPKPSTIKRIAAQVGCDPAELLEGVETDYDRLRGAVSPTPEKANGITLTRNEARALRILRSVPPAEQHDALVVFGLVARRYRRSPAGASDVQADAGRTEKASATTRKARHG